MGSFLDSFSSEKPTPVSKEGETVVVYEEKDGKGYNTKISEPEKVVEEKPKATPTPRATPKTSPSAPLVQLTADTLKIDEPAGSKTNKKAVSQNDLNDLNEKIKTDPQLRELVSTFKKLKTYYSDLSSKYSKLDKAHNNLKKSLKKPAMKKETGVTSGSISSTSPKKSNAKSTPTKNTTTAAHHAPAQTATAVVEVKHVNDTALAVPNTTEKRVTKAYAVKKLEIMRERLAQVQNALRVSNPFNIMGAYPEITLEYFNSYPAGRPFYNKWNYGLYNDDDYCELVDFYNLAHPENMFTRRNFFTDYAKNGLARDMVMRKIGFDLSWKVSKYMPREIFKSRSFHLDPRINNFFTKRVDLHIYHEIGKHFMCATQMYNHIPGHGVLKRKDLIVDSVE